MFSWLALSHKNLFSIPKAAIIITCESLGELEFALSESYSDVSIFLKYHLTVVHLKCSGTSYPMWSWIL